MRRPTAWHPTARADAAEFGYAGSRGQPGYNRSAPQDQGGRAGLGERHTLVAGEVNAYRVGDRSLVARLAAGFRADEPLTETAGSSSKRYATPPTATEDASLSQASIGRGLPVVQALSNRTCLVVLNPMVPAASGCSPLLRRRSR